MTNEPTLYLVGGAVRDHIRGVKSKDIDFAVETTSFSDMREWLVEKRFEIFVESPQYFTIRARAPKTDFAFGGMQLGNQTFDFTLCRKERDYSDGRHPDSVEIGTLYEDLARRDYRMNAIALAEDGTIIDPHNGVNDIKYERIEVVGGVERLQEDGLRILRGLRQAVQLNFYLAPKAHNFILSKDAVKALEPISVDRIRDEVGKMFKSNSFESIKLFNQYPNIAKYIFTEREVWLEPTTAKK